MNIYLKKIPFYERSWIFLLFFILSYNSFSQLEFRGVSPSSIAQPFEFSYTSNTEYIDAWGGEIETPGFSLEGSLELIEEDTLGCGTYSEDLTNKIAFIYRGECTFFEKIYAAQTNGAKAVVIVNNVDEELFFMTGGQTSYLVNIPAILISKQDGEILRNAMENNTVEVMLRNIQNYFQYNLALESNFSLIPKAYATPQLTIDAENPFLLDLGAFLFNRGSNDVSNAHLHAQVTLYDSVLSECISVGSITSGDTLFFDLPTISFDNLEIGKYQLIYYSDIENYLDEDPYSDTLTYNFEVTEDRFSLCPLNSLNEPDANHYTTSSVSNLASFKQCIKYESAKASEVAAEGLFFSVQNEYSSLNNQEVLISCFQWNNEYNGDLINLSGNFTDLSLIDESYYIIEEDLQMENIYAPFNQLIELENNTKYLFCITPISTPDLLIGYNNNLDYSLNNYAFSESVNPIEINSYNDPQPHWYNGFSSGITPAIAISLVNSNLLDISEDKVSTINVYPNPLTNVLTISLESIENHANIEIIDLTGKTVLNQNIELINNHSNINVEHLEKGMYLLKVTSNDNEISIFNIVKQ